MAAARATIPPMRNAHTGRTPPSALVVLSMNASAISAGPAT